MLRISKALRDLVPFVQIEKRIKHPWKSAIFTKSNTPPWEFFTFFKLYKWYQIAQSISYYGTREHDLAEVTLQRLI